MSGLAKPRKWRNNDTLNGKVNAMVNSLETITFHHHHYVRKTGLKKAIKKLISEAEQSIK